MCKNLFIHLIIKLMMRIIIENIFEKEVNDKPRETKGKKKKKN